MVRRFFTRLGGKTGQSREQARGVHRVMAKAKRNGVELTLTAEEAKVLKTLLSDERWPDAQAHEVMLNGIWEALDNLDDE
jgi:hypothetical protein